MRLSKLALPLVLFVAACKPATTLPERLVLSTGTLPLDWGEQQTVSARAFVGMKATGLDGLTWSSENEAVATVTPRELGEVSIQGVGEGTTTVTASLREATASVTVTVAARVIVLERIEVSASSATLPKGLKLQLSATGHYNDGSTRDLTPTAAWASADGTKATINGSGLVTAVAAGQVQLRALKSGQVGTFTLTVTDATLSSLDVRPASTSLALGTTQAFTATGRFSDSSSMPLTTMVTWASSDDTTVSVDTTGRATAAALGMADVTASFMGLMGTAHVTVTDATLRTLEAVPSSFTLPLGSTKQLALNGHYSDGTTQDLTTQATWRSGTVAVATVTDGGLVTAVGQGLSVISANVGNISTNASVTSTAPQLTAIQVAPQSPSVPLGLTRSFTATGLYTDTSTRDLTQSLTWSSSDAGVATVSNLAGENGLVRTVSEGTITLSASNGTLTGSTTVTIAPAILVSMQVSPNTVLVPAGRSQQLTADGTFSDGTNRDVTPQVTWSSADAGVAIVSNDAGTEGLVTGIAPGTTSVDATLGLVTASRTVVVGAPVLTRIDVTGVSSLAKGRTTQLSATGTYSDGSTRPLTATWSSSSSTTASVNGTGLVTARGLGTATLTATSGGLSGTLDVTVTAAEVDALALTAASIPLGLTKTFTALATYSDGTQAPLSTGLTWSTVDTTIATVDASGLVSTLAQGQTQLSVQLGSVMASTTVTVSAPVVVSLTLTPNTAFSLAKQATQQVTANGVLSNGQPVDVTASATWSSTASTIASVTAGLVTGLAPGVASITASQDGVSASVSVTVTRPALQSLAVTPVTPHVLRTQTRAFVATATYVDSSTEVVTSLVTWSSSDPLTATINVNGVATGVAVGTSTVTASWNGQSDSTVLTVDSFDVTAISISGPNRIAAGTSAQLSAIATLTDAGTTDITLLTTWASANSATVAFPGAASTLGLAQGVSAGTTTVTATLGITSAPFSLTVADTNAPYVGSCAKGLVISQLYGAGGNTGAALQNDFVELHNPTGAPISLNGLSVQYASAAGTFAATNQVVPLANVSIPAGGFFLLKLSGGTIGQPVTGDQTSAVISMSATTGKIALVNGTTAIASCNASNVVDLVGFGGANCFEGTVAPGPSATTAILRPVSGCRDDNNNSTDFVATTSTITPRSLSTAPILCACSSNGRGSARGELESCQLNSPSSLTVNAGDASAPVSATLTQTGVTDTAGFNATVRVQVGFAPLGVDPTSASGWRWWPAPGSIAGSPSDVYAGPFIAPVSGSYAFGARASVDGVNWTACDLNGAGSTVGLSFETAQLGALSVP